MAEQEQSNQNDNKPKIYTIDKSSNFAATIDKLFFQWFDDKTYDLRKNNDETIDTSKTLDSLTKIVRRLQSDLNASKEKEAVELRDKLADFLSGNANSATDILNDRPKEDYVSKILWLINSVTTVSVLSGELAETGKPLQHGPLRNLNVSSQNIEQVMIPNVRNSRQMKTASEFLNKVLPKTFAAVAKHNNLVRAAATRAAVTGNEYHNQPTMDSMYKDLGEALIFVSTAFYMEANRAFTETGKRIAADRMKNLDFSKLSAKKQDKMMQLLRSAFRQYANLTASANTFSSINDKIMMDAAYAAWYTDMNEQEKKSSGFNDKNLTNMTYVRAFARKYKDLFERHYTRYSNLFVDGMTAALKKEQETVKKDWFENKITGEREFRRGRLAGHGAKFMHTGPMEWLDKKLSEKKKASLWIFPKLAFTTLKILTNPTLHKARKKLTGALFAGLRSFAQGVHEGFTKTGQSTEITYEDVIKKIKEATDKFNKLKNDKAVITNESVSLTEASEDEEESDIDFDTVKVNLNNYQREFANVKDLFSKSMEDEAVKSDREAYNTAFDELQGHIERSKLVSKLDYLLNPDNDTNVPADLIELAKEVKSLYDEFTDDRQESIEKEKSDTASNAADYKSSGDTIQVGEQAVQICEDVFATLNKYIARQWNLLAAHSNHEDMPLCVEYTWIDTPDLVKGAAKPRTTAEMTLTDWLTYRQLNEAEQHEENSTPSATHDNDDSRTAEYPKKYNGMYRYHGLKLVASTTDKSKTGFGIFADRLLKIADPVKDFCATVEFAGNETSRKTFNNDQKRDESVEIELAHNELNEDIGNAILKKVDLAKDKAANKTKSGINKLGKGAGYALGSLVHGIAHNSTADKDRELAKTIEDSTGFVYSYNKSLKLDYVRDGAKILAKHSLTKYAKSSFEDIATLASALIDSNIANSHSIKAMSESLQRFADAIKSAKFESCETVIDWQFADTINKGGINDMFDGKSCMIKGIKINNFDSATEYASNFTINAGAEHTDTPATTASTNNSEIESGDSAEQHHDTSTPEETSSFGTIEPRTIMLGDNEVPRHEEPPTSVTDHERILSNDWKNMNREQRKNALKKGKIADEAGKVYKKPSLTGEMKYCDTTDLSKLFEQVNSIDWKEVFNG